MEKQVYKNFEVIIINDKEDLSKCRQKGLESAKGEIASFIDDDTECSSGWSKYLARRFKDKRIIGVTGPCTIPKTHIKNRDLLKSKVLRAFYNFAFIGKNKNRPAFIASSGAVSTRSNFPMHSRRIQEAGYLEACNMSVRRKEAIEVGGFDSSYKETSEWSEVDLALKLKKLGMLIFDTKVALKHLPSKAGVYKNRLSTKHRWDNFLLFQRRWVKPCFRSYLYRSFVWIYFKMKTLRIL